MRSKEEIRKQMLDTRVVCPADPEDTGRAVASALAVLPEWTKAHAVAAYCACRGEVDVTPCILNALTSGRTVFLPRFNPAVKAYEMAAVADLVEDVTAGAFGIREPVAERTAASAERMRASDICWLVPGVAFDASGNRLGRGGGYYDALLKDVAGVRIGVAFEWQVMELVPAGPHDVPMDFVVTERRVIRCLRADAGLCTENQHGKG
jgi:5-formyltetrahydrofolate cyclo-ligase